MDNQPTYLQYNWSDIQAYLQGKMNAQDMHLLEKQALQDPFLADALEGLGNTETAIAINDIEFLNQQTTAQPEQAKILPLTSANKKTNWWLMGGAAAIFIVAVFGIFRLSTKKEDQTIASVTTTNTKPSNENQTKPNTIADSVSKAETVNEKTLPNKIEATAKNSITPTQSDNAVLKFDEKNIATISDDKTQNINNQSVAAAAMSKQTADAETAKPLTQNITDVITGQASVIVVTPENKDARQQSTSIANNSRSNFSFSNNSNLIHGKAVTPQGDPIAFANVQIPNSNFQTLTDKLGNFSVPTKSLTDTTVSIQINSIGYNATNAIASNNSNNYFTLTPNNNTLNDVVVTNVGTAKKRSMASAVSKMVEISMDTILSPVGGWPAFENYLNSLGYKNSLYDSSFGNGRTTKFGAPLHEEVVVEFKADRKGNPTDIQVIQSPSQETSTKAIEAIKKGPKWTSKSKKAKAKLAIKL